MRGARGQAMGTIRRPERIRRGEIKSDLTSCPDLTSSQIAALNHPGTPRAGTLVDGPDRWGLRLRFRGGYDRDLQVQIPVLQVHDVGISSSGLVLKRRVRLDVIAAQLQRAVRLDPRKCLNRRPVIKACVVLSDYERSARGGIDPHVG